MDRVPKLPSLKAVKNQSTMVRLKREWYDLNFTFNRNENTTKALSFPSKMLKAPHSAFSSKRVVGKETSEYHHK